MQFNICIVTRESARMLWRL